MIIRAVGLSAIDRRLASASLSADQPTDAGSTSCHAWACACPPIRRVAIRTNTNRTWNIMTPLSTAPRMKAAKRRYSGASEIANGCCALVAAKSCQSAVGPETDPDGAAHHAPAMRESIFATEISCDPVRSDPRCSKTPSRPLRNKRLVGEKERDNGSSNV